MNFFRRYQLRKWTLGCDLRNGALLQFTKTEPFTGQYRIIRLGLVSFAQATRDISNKETRTWINIGWGQGWYWISRLRANR